MLIHVAFIVVPLAQPSGQIMGSLFLFCGERSHWLLCLAALSLIQKMFYSPCQHGGLAALHVSSCRINNIHY